MFELPIGKKAAFIDKKVCFNVAGLFQCTYLIFELIDFVQFKFEYDLPIKYIYGSPQIRWNGGRVLLKQSFNKLDKFLIEKEFSDIVSRGIIPLLTFSNVLLEKNDLKDKDCNWILKLANEYNAQIVVVSDLLEEYIRNKYPQIPIHASVIKTVYEDCRDINFYSCLSRRYSNYVIHPDDNFKFELLDDLDKRNAEIILNERCIYNCKLRSGHYESISREQKTLVDGKYEYERYLKKCISIPETKQSDWKIRNVSLSLDEFKKISNMDYKIFKIQGRTDSLYLYFFDLIRYMLESNISFPTTYTIFLSKIEKFIREQT